MVDEPIQISASLGIATYPDMAGTANQLYEVADYALYHSKQRHTASHCIFSLRLHEQRLSEVAVGQPWRKGYREVK